MNSPALICDECGTLLYTPCSTSTPADITNNSRLTAEQKSILNIVCSSERCPSRLPFDGSAETMQDIQMEEHLEQPEDAETLDPRNIMGDKQPQLSNQQVPQQGQHHEQQQERDNELELQLQSLFDLPQEVDGKPVHRGVNPCRRCYQEGANCRWELGSDSCEQCQSKRKCNRYLGGAKPHGCWATRIIIEDYAAPFSISASRMKCRGAVYIIEYQVKYAYKTGVAGWQPAKILKDFPWILKKFHQDMPDMPGPEDWLIEEEGDAFFYGDSDHISL